MTNSLSTRFRNAARPTSAFSKNTPPGTTVTGRIAAAEDQPKLKFGGAAGEVELDQDGRPVTQLVITLDTESGAKNLYVSWRMEQAIGIALADADADFEIGGTLSVTFTGPDPAFPKARLFTATYTPAGAWAK
ncbi:hypothetical protein [Nocardia carnea]|uniref:hypothetical protein n=1 Tax=Nocardia carnea TaxID=37328 RepID=UPI002456F757|nr:hypothetical protein [Nocardia carnea]